MAFLTNTLFSHIYFLYLPYKISGGRKTKFLSIPWKLYTANSHYFALW